MSEKDEARMSEMVRIATKAVEISGGKLRLEQKDKWYELWLDELKLGEFGESVANEVIEWAMMEYANMLVNIRMMGLHGVWDQIRHEAKELKSYLNDGIMKEAYGQIFTIPGLTESNSDKG